MKMFKRVIILGFTLGLILVNPFSTRAANEECTEAYFKENYIQNKVSYERSGNTVVFHGVDKAKMYYTVTGDPTHYEPGDDGTFSVTISGAKYSVSIHLKEDDGVCAKDESYFSYTFGEDSVIRNSSYDTVCASYRAKYQNNAKMKNRVPYCFQEYVSEEVDGATVSNWIHVAENGVRVEEPTIKEDPLTNVKDVNIGKLTCDYYAGGNKKVYSHTETDQNGGGEDCRQTCKEVVEVLFDPPVATQSGMCFSYVAEVRSKVECEYKYTAPEPTKKSACYEIATCSSGGGSTHIKGGPNSDFDSCVTSCDNGIYSQKCIDSCYNKIYKTASLISYDTKGVSLLGEEKQGSILKTAEENVTCLNPNTMARTEENYRKLYEQKQLYPGGNYANGKWIPGGVCSSNVGYYYFSTLSLTRETVESLQGVWRGYGDNRRYGASHGNGLLYRTQINGYNNACGDYCYWSNRCSKDQPVTKVQAENEYKEAKEKWDHAKAACENQEKKCSTETGVYTVAVEETSSSDKKSTSTYEANQKQNGALITNNKWDNQDTHQNSIVKETSGICMGGTTTDGKGNCTTTTQKTQSACSVSAKENSDDCTCYDYRDVITFPKNYINNKTGQPTANPSLGEKYYTSVGNEFCTKLTTKSTNLDWYNWKVYGNGSSPTAEEKKKIDTNTKTNINITIKEFGLFGWGFDLNCFYALIRNPKNCKDGKCVEEGASEASVTSDFIARSIDLTNMFPVEESTGKAREAHYNWNCNGTNLENEDYIIQPEGLKDTIEQAGEAIYDEAQADRYLDYDIYLTKSDLKKIRKYNDDQGSYYKPTYGSEKIVRGSSKTYGVTVYQSSLLDELKDQGSIKKRGLIGCNNQDSETSCNKSVYTTHNGNTCVNEYNRGGNRE